MQWPRFLVKASAEWAVFGCRVFLVEGLSIWQWYCCSYSDQKKLVDQDQVDLRPADIFWINSLRGTQTIFQLILISPSWNKSSSVFSCSSWHVVGNRYQKSERDFTSPNCYGDCLSWWSSFTSSSKVFRATTYPPWYNILGQLKLIQLLHICSKILNTDWQNLDPDGSGTSILL